MHLFLEELIQQAQHDNVQKISVGAAIVEGNKILMLKRREDDFMPNIYELPGGGIEGTESLIDALKRELIEETNCTVDSVIGYIGAIDFPSSQGLPTRRFNFLVKPQLPFTVKLSEHADYQWISPDDAAQFSITNQTRRLIATVRDNNIYYF